ncbi:MAG: hypothetical protein UX47_C0004G0036 [Candidatus Collierbacteria bacterium GW2011_GWA2_46_26]|uniref:Uncharacterized protein n=1 Tax=Candidatus Collierbacteria bacterium GW2011_GWA2_46_26 TaxID=1618381 RepID=A0A0G1PKY2_9BACT|nr:MAG: hypothetical protein UX47_C0004G0036 [Candidatus Collierbacteria bacterium GW2011_GWA2_46_26]
MSFINAIETIKHDFLTMIWFDRFNIEISFF